MIVIIVITISIKIKNDHEKFFLFSVISLILLVEYKYRCTQLLLLVSQYQAVVRDHYSLTTQSQSQYISKSTHMHEQMYFSTQFYQVLDLGNSMHQPSCCDANTHGRRYTARSVPELLQLYYSWLLTADTTRAKVQRRVQCVSASLIR